MKVLASFALSGALWMPAGDGASEVSYVDASLDLRGELLDWRFVDVDLDGRMELCLALRNRAGARELHLHRTSEVRIESEPYQKIHVLDDVLAYGFADVRAEQGRELLLLTRTGVFSYSTELSGYRGNARRLIESELIYDVPDPRGLPYWDYVLPGAGGDLVLVPVRAGLEVYGPPPGAAEGDAERSAGAAAYDRITRVALNERSFRRRDDASSRSADRRASRNPDNISVRVDIDRDFGPFYPGALPGAGSAPSQILVSSGRSIPAPALLDVNGDGRLDLIVWQHPELSIHLHDGRAYPDKPSRVERLPDYLQREEFDLSLTLVDLNGDGVEDLLAQLEQEDDGFENKEITLFLLVNDGERFFPAQPQQLMRFEAGLVIPEVADVDEDGLPDLFLREFLMPDLIGTVTGLEFKLVNLLYLSEPKGNRLVERSPSLKQERSYDENTVIDAIASRDVSFDCNGDGIPDMVEVDVQGNIAIRRLLLDEGFFGGDTWKLEESPWKRFEVRGSIASLSVSDLNGDGLGDIVSQTDEMLRVLLSSGRAGGR